MSKSCIALYRCSFWDVDHTISSRCGRQTVILPHFWYWTPHIITVCLLPTSALNGQLRIWSIHYCVTITNLPNNTFSSVKFTRGNEKNMSFLLISKSQVVWKKNTIGLSFKCMNVIWMTPLTLLDHLPLSRSFLFPVLHCSESMLCVMLLLLLALLFFVFSLLFIYILSSKCSKHWWECFHGPNVRSI